MKVQKSLISILMLVGLVQAEIPMKWFETKLGSESINTAFVFDGQMFTGTEKGIYSGKAMYLDGYQEKIWDLQPIKSLYESEEQDPRLENTTSIATLEGRLIYAISDSGLFYINSKGIFDKEGWEKDTLLKGGVAKLSGNGKSVYLLANNKIYQKQLGSEWKVIPFSVYTQGSSEPVISDFKICGNDIVVVIHSLYKSPQTWSDIHISANNGISWVEAATHISNLVDYTSYKINWNDPFANLAFCQNERNSDNATLTFIEGFGRISVDSAPETRTVHEIKGQARSISCSYVTKSTLPKFYISLDSSLYTADYHYSLEKEVNVPTHIGTTWVESNDNDLLSYSDKGLWYTARWYGDVGLKSLESPKMNSEIIVKDDILTISVDGAVGYSLFSLNGKLLKVGAIEDHREIISIGDLATGSYIIKVNLGNSVITHRIVKN